MVVHELDFLSEADLLALEGREELLVGILFEGNAVLHLDDVLVDGVEQLLKVGEFRDFLVLVLLNRLFLALHHPFLLLQALLDSQELPIFLMCVVAQLGPDLEDTFIVVSDDAGCLAVFVGFN